MKNSELIIGTVAAAAAGLGASLVRTVPGVGSLVTKFPEASGALIGAAGMYLAGQKGELGQAGKVMSYVGFAASALGIARRLGLIKAPGPSLVASDGGWSVAENPPVAADPVDPYFDPTAPAKQPSWGVTPVSLVRASVLPTTYNRPGVAKVFM